MSRTPQEIYASNLLCEQTFGYPLRNPSPGTSNAEGCRIGDVGYVDALGEFKVVLNINSGDEERHGRALGFDLDHPYAKPAFHPRQMFMAGVVRKNLVAEKPRCLHTTAHPPYLAYLAFEGLISNLLPPEGRVRYSYFRTGLSYPRSRTKTS